MCLVGRILHYFVLFSVYAKAFQCIANARNMITQFQFKINNSCSLCSQCTLCRVQLNSLNNRQRNRKKSRQNIQINYELNSSNCFNAYRLSFYPLSFLSLLHTHTIIQVTSIFWPHYCPCSF